MTKTVKIIWISRIILSTIAIMALLFAGYCFGGKISVKKSFMYIIGYGSGMPLNNNESDTVKNTDSHSVLPLIKEELLAELLYEAPQPPETEKPAETPEKPTDIPQILTPEQLYAPDYSSVPENENKVVPIDMSDGQTAGSLKYKNQSNYQPDINTLSKSEYPIQRAIPTSAGGSNEPLVLIIHTHGTECYIDEGKLSYTAETPTRTQDTSKNVVAVGQALADTLNSNGIPTLHDTTMHDKDSYSAAYDNSERAVIEYLKKYPSIQYVFDVHRDSLVRSDSSKLKPVACIDGKAAAQVMLVVGTNSMGANHPNWMQNLTVASIFQSHIIQKYGNLMRPINLRGASFNAEHAPGSLLIEIGSCGNTLSEAKQAAILFGNAISEIILKS